MWHACMLQQRLLQLQPVGALSSQDATGAHASLWIERPHGPRLHEQGKVYDHESACPLAARAFTCSSMSSLVRRLTTAGGSSDMFKLEFDTRRSVKCIREVLVYST